MPYESPFGDKQEGPRGTWLTITPLQPEYVDDRVEREILTAAEHLNYPAVKIYPEDRSRGLGFGAVTVVGPQGWSVFAQMMTRDQLLGARRLLLVIASGGEAEWCD